MVDIVNRGLLRSLRHTLYSLKHSFGGTIYVYTLLEAATSYTTGVKTSTQTATRIARAIVLPVQIQRELAKGLSANKTFAKGGTYDAGTRLFVIDAKDVSADFDIDLEDWIVYNSQRFSLKTIDKLELNAGWLLVGSAIATARGPLPQQEVIDNLVLTQTVGVA